MAPILPVPQAPLAQRPKPLSRVSDPAPLPQDGRLQSQMRLGPAASPREGPLRNALSRHGNGSQGRSHITRSITPHDNPRFGAKPRNLFLLPASRVRITKIWRSASVPPSPRLAALSRSWSACRRRRRFSHRIPTCDYRSSQLRETRTMAAARGDHSGRVDWI